MRPGADVVVRMRHEPGLRGEALPHDGVEPGSGLLRREVAVGPAHRQDIVGTHPHAVGVGERERTVVFPDDQRRRVVHDARPAVVGGGQVVVRETERVPDFVGGELPHAGEREFHRVGAVGHLRQVRETRRRRQPAGVGAARVGRQPHAGGAVGRHHPDAVQVVLAKPQAAEVHIPLDDLPGARVADRTAVGPAARPAVRPMDHVVADVLRVGAGRQDFDPERVDESRRLERLVPPSGAVEQGAPHRFRHARVEVVDDRLHRFGHLRRGIAFMEPVPGGQPHGHRLVYGRRVVHELRTVHADARVRFPHFESGAGKPHQRVVLAQGHRFAARRHAANQRSRGVAREGEERLHFRVVGKPLRPRQVERAPVAIHPEVPLPGAADPLRRAVGVAEEEVGRVHQHAVPGLGLHRKTPEDGGRESVFHGAHFLRVVADRPVGHIRLHEQDARADAHRFQDGGHAELSAVEAHRVAAQTGSERDLVEESLAAGNEFGEQFPGGLLPVERHEPGDRRHPGSPRLDRRRFAGAGALRPGGGRRGERERDDHRPEEAGAAAEGAVLDHGEWTSGRTGAERERKRNPQRVFSRGKGAGGVNRPWRKAAERPAARSADREAGALLPRTVNRFRRVWARGPRVRRDSPKSPRRSPRHRP